MKIGLAQTKVFPLQFEQNYQTIERYVKIAKEQDVETIVFSELNLTGYMLKDNFYSLNHSMINSFIEEIRHYLAKSYEMNIIFGSTFTTGKDLDIRNQDGRLALFNAAYIIDKNGEFAKRTTEILNSIKEYDIFKGIMPKTHLPNYRFFDDKRYFKGLLEFIFQIAKSPKDVEKIINYFYSPFMLPDKNNKIHNIGVQICEDMWYEHYKLFGESFNVYSKIASNKADAIINISASPYNGGKEEAKNKKVDKMINDSKKKPVFLYVNEVGAQNTGENIVSFYGGTSIHNSKGLIAESNSPFEEDFITYELKKKFFKMPDKNIKHQKQDLIKMKYLAIKEAVIHMERVSKIDGYVVGASGGIDSSLVLAILKSATNKPIEAINMPSEWNSKETIDSAQKLCENLDIPLKTMPITNVKNVIVKEFKKANLEITDILDENIQAKIRGNTFLSNYTQTKKGENWVFTNNGCKTELATLYYTLDGDGRGYMSLIGDLYKDEVFDMARFLNTEIYENEVIPWSIIPDKNYQFSENQIVPSAELKNKQTDPMKPGYHDAILRHWMRYTPGTFNSVIDNWHNRKLDELLHVSNDVLYAYDVYSDFNEFLKDIEWLYKRFKIYFKRKQAPPIAIVSGDYHGGISAFGGDLREVII